MLWCKLPNSGCMTNQIGVADGTPCVSPANGTAGVSDSLYTNYILLISFPVKSLNFKKAL